MWGWYSNIKGDFFEMANKFDSFIEIVNDMFSRIFFIIVSMWEHTRFYKYRNTIILVCSSYVALRIISDHIYVSNLISRIAAKCLQVCFRIIVWEFRGFPIDLYIEILFINCLRCSLKTCCERSKCDTIQSKCVCVCYVIVDSEYFHWTLSLRLFCGSEMHVIIIIEWFRED